MKLHFEQLSETHAAELLPIWQDSDVIKYTYVKNIQNVEDAKTKIARYLNYPHGLIGPFVAKHNGKVIGLAAGMSPENQPNVSEIFFHFEKASWRKGFGTQAIGFLLDNGFNKKGLQEIQAQAVTENKASWMLLEKNGFAHKELKENAFRNEKNVYSYAMYFDEYSDQKKL
ncbi:MAG: GNAT family N-acetyltransferase [Sphaerochaetaceae bacterium]|nr:GNAT family N-acetyltransferase [Sphaerochaetaceae bacterium]